MHSFLSTGRVKNGRFSVQGKAIQWPNRTVGEEGLSGWEDCVTSLRDWGKKKMHVTRFLFVMSFLMKSRLLSLLDEKGCVAAKLVFAVNYTFTNKKNRRSWILMRQHYPRRGRCGLAPDYVGSIENMLLSRQYFLPLVTQRRLRDKVRVKLRMLYTLRAVCPATFTRYVAGCNMFLRLATQCSRALYSNLLSNNSDCQNLGVVESLMGRKFLQSLLFVWWFREMSLLFQTWWPACMLCDECFRCLLQHDYLEAVTNGYTMSGVLVSESKGRMVLPVYCVKESMRSFLNCFTSRDHESACEILYIANATLFRRELKSRCFKRNILLGTNITKLHRSVVTREMHSYCTVLFIYLF